VFAGAVPVSFKSNTSSPCLRQLDPRSAKPWCDATLTKYGGVGGFSAVVSEIPGKVYSKYLYLGDGLNYSQGQ